MRFVDT